MYKFARIKHFKVDNIRINLFLFYNVTIHNGVINDVKQTLYIKNVLKLNPIFNS